MKNFTNNLKSLITAYGVDAALEAIDEILNDAETLEELDAAITDELSYAAENSDR